MIRELQELASSSCLDMSQLKTELTEEYTGQKPDGHMSELITQLRQQLEELEQFAFKNGQLPTGELPLRVLHQRQNLVLKKLQEKIPSLKIEFEKPTASHDHFMELVERDFEQGMEPLREKDKLLDQLRTQITDLERFVKLLQAEIGSPPPSPIERKKEEEITNRVPPTTSAESDDIRPLDLRKPIDQMKSQQKDACKKSSFFGHFIGHGFSRKHFERNELKHTTMGNHYGYALIELGNFEEGVFDSVTKERSLRLRSTKSWRRSTRIRY
jgi:hypothetical protein